MNDVQLLTFVITPLAVVALGWGIAYWARQ
jgi:hypothetical protein